MAILLPWWESCMWRLPNPKPAFVNVICVLYLCLEDDFILFCAILQAVRILAFWLCYFKPVSPQIKCPDVFCEFLKIEKP